MTTGISGQAAAANTTRVGAMPFAVPTPKAGPLADTGTLPDAYYLDKGASKLANYKSYDEDGQPRWFFQDGTVAKARQPQAGDAAQGQLPPIGDTTAKARQPQASDAAGKTQPEQVEDAAAAQNEPVVCETCANRKYQDVSSDPGVSFQTATHVSAQASLSAVTRHEREHVARETRDAEENGQKAITSIRIYMDQCPECGKWYASGGLTKVTKISDPAVDEPEKDQEKEFNAS